MDLNWILIFIIAIHLTYEQDSTTFEVRDFTLSRPYASVFSTSSSHWQFTGNTLATDRYIRLTADAQSKVGGLWNTLPIPYADWEIQVQFKMHGNNKLFFGDGMVIWYVREPKLTGSVFGYKDYFNGLGIFLDTYGNNKDHPVHTYPYISAIVNNGSLHYDHDNDGINITLDGCEAAIHARDIDSTVAIRYENDRLTVSVDAFEKGVWHECFSIGNIQLPTHYYLGFTAATGELSDNHDIIAVHLFQLESTRLRTAEDRRSIVPSALLNTTVEVVFHNPSTSSWSAWKIFFLVSGLILLSVVGIVGYSYRQNRRRGPRFY